MLLKQDISMYGEIEYIYIYTRKSNPQISKDHSTKKKKKKFPENIVTQIENVGIVNLLQMTIENRINQR